MVTILVTVYVIKKMIFF